ncbi:MAG: Nicotinate phosphoribosyltransferase [Microgenomates bacterium OLB22]|nr:MAG: Nicotinate phosphoribosyltransferase [Microgenomates bacterium OLB22]
MALVAFYDDKTIGSRQVLAGWRLLYGENLSVVLPDTYTTDLFLSKILTPDEARMWAAIRQDSGDPKAFVDKVLVYYHKHRIDPMSKTIIFSDGLDTRSAIDLARYCQGKIKCLFGIGTSFTNNVGLKPLKIVIKIVQLMGSDGAWIPAVKESDDPAKSTGLASLKAAARA